MTRIRYWLTHINGQEIDRGGGGGGGGGDATWKQFVRRLRIIYQQPSVIIPQTFNLSLVSSTEIDLKDILKIYA